MAVAFWDEIERRRARWDVLEHPFYARWSAGDLSHDELALYASEYDHAVVAIADASRRAADSDTDLQAHAEEEAAHTSLWRSFARAAGWGGSRAWYFGEEPLPTTEACARTWTGELDRDLPRHLVTLYAVESAQPGVSALKLEALVRHYAFDDGPATEYFRVHARLDRDHAALMRATLDRLLADADTEALLDQAEAVHRSYWEMLDGLEALAEA